MCFQGAQRNYKNKVDTLNVSNLILTYELIREYSQCEMWEVFFRLAQDLIIL